MLPNDSKERKTYPIATGFLDYFPDAVAEIANVSYTGNEQHNSGQPLHWDRSKSTDHADALMRHFMERGGIDTDGMLHTAKLAWRALAMLQEELEAEQLELDSIIEDDENEIIWPPYQDSSAYDHAQKMQNVWLACDDEDLML